MNTRNQRRFDGKAASAAPKAAEAAYHKTLGITARDSGKPAEALEHLQKSLTLDPSQADVHFMIAALARTQPELGIDIGKINKGLRDKKNLLNSYRGIIDIFRQNGKFMDARFCQEELCRLAPDDAQALMDLGLLYNLTGDLEKAALTLSQSVNRAPSNKYAKGVYSTSLYVTEFTSFHPEVKQGITRCFERQDDVNLLRLGAVWVGLMKKDPAFEGFWQALDAPDFDAWADKLDKDTGRFLRDPYFIGGLRVLLLNDRAVETVLTKLRRYMALNLETLKRNGRIALFETFLYALAEQCFFNEYVYAEGEDEIAAIKNIVIPRPLSGGSIIGETDGKHPDYGSPAFAGDDKRASGDDGTRKAAIALLACYSPLYRAMPDGAATLHALAKKDRNFARLVKTQFDDPVEEERLKATLPAFGALSNAISQAVRGQYEENPYPRWTTLITLPMPNDDLPSQDMRRDDPCDILIAGCGTGRQALSAAVRQPKSKVTAIDLSRASIAYGLRKAKETGLDRRINFVHADILSMKDWPETFDIIECTGVLHHMEDPFAGWEALASRLRPGGLMKIGLYSESARQPIVEARNFIAAQGYPSTPEGIRACRQAIFALPPEHPLRQLTRTGDFYSTSTVRDLIFHVQEHRMTLPQIKGMMERLGLECTKFTVSDPGIGALYDEHFPGDLRRANIDNWAKLEEQHPLIFFNMYQFWCRKI